MCDPISIGVVTAASGAFSAYSQYQSGVAESKMQQYNADASRAEGKAALARGETQSNLIQDAAKLDSVRQAQSAAQLSASQKASLAANGIDLGSVTAQDISLDTSNRSQMDEFAIRRNADLNAWSAQSEAANQNWQSNVMADQYGYAAKNAKKAGLRNAFGTILSTASQVGGGLSKAGVFDSKLSQQSQTLGFDTRKYR